MGEKIVVGPINKGLKNDRTAFVIDNDSFPTLINAYQWRGRVKRKRGTSFLGRLQRYYASSDTTYNDGSATLTLNGSGIGNLISGFTLEIDANIVPGTVTITDTMTLVVYTDAAMDGTLSPSGTINYATGQITILSSANDTMSAVFVYYPNLPVMGLEDLALNSNQFPGTLAFDTTFSYNISPIYPYPINDVTFYKNPQSGTYPGYVQKTIWKRFHWNGANYQQFWTVNYQGALWVTNGVNVPFSITNVGMQYKLITNVVIDAVGPPALVTITIANHGLVIGDFVFINEVQGITGINFQTGYVVAVFGINSFQVEFPNATLGGAYTTGGIVQYLTNNADHTLDCIKWYDGDPTDGNPTSPTFVPGKGWVNFAPPLSREIFSVANLPEAQYYLAGAKMIVPFKDRLLFLGPVVQTSAPGSQIYLPDTIVFSQNGTTYYTASFTGDPSLATTVFTPILVPTNETATPTAFWEDQTGFGGFLTAGISQAMVTSSSNEDVIIIGFDPYIQARLIYTGNDILPFNLFVINSELGSSSTFSTVNMDQGVITRGARGFIITTQTNAQRIDLEIPDEVFEINLTNNGTERMCAQRDFINEWIYFTYPVNDINTVFPNQTLQYNYRDSSWAIFFETYTTYGSFREQTGFTWATSGAFFSSWNVWNQPWKAGSSTLLQQKVIAGNQQGFIVFRDEGTNESQSLQVSNISGSTVTSANHNLNEDDFIVINGALGTIGPFINGRIFQVSPTINVNSFVLDPNLDGTGTYLGGATITRLYRPYIQTKQFPVAWGMGRKVRIGVQQYLFTTTPAGQIQLLIFLSQDDNNPYNIGPIVPSISPLNSALIYSTNMYTCPEGTNLGLTPANINLQIPTSISQSQTWHRMNTSLIGDTVQIGFTLSDDQMKELSVSGNPIAITGASQTNPAVLNSTAQFSAGQFIKITGVRGMTELNNNIYYVISSSPTQVTIQVDATTFTPYISGGISTPVAFNNQFAEIELHGFILDVSPSQLLV